MSKIKISEETAAEVRRVLKKARDEKAAIIERNKIAKKSVIQMSKDAGAVKNTTPKQLKEAKERVKSKKTK